MTTDDTNEFKYVIAYGLAIALFIFLIKFKAGYVLVYYILILAIITLLLTNAKFISTALAPLNTSQGA